MDRATKFWLLVSRLILGIALSISAFAIIYFPLRSFDPFTVNSLTLPGEPACRDEDVRPYVNQVIDPDQFDEMRSIEMDSTWIAVDVEGLPAGYKAPGGVVTLFPSDFSPGEYEGSSRALAQAPDDPGEWQLYREYTIRSNAPLLPPIQETSAYADNTTTVLLGSDPECSPDGGE